MMRMISKRFFLTAGFSALATMACARAPERSLRPQGRPAHGSAGAATAPSTAGPTQPKVASAQALIARAELGGKVGFAVADAKTGLVLESGNGRTGLPPASVTKAVTALYALATLGAGHRFYTELRLSGTISNGVLQGDLILKGGGDPTLDTDRMAELAARSKRQGCARSKASLLLMARRCPVSTRSTATNPSMWAITPRFRGSRSTLTVFILSGSVQAGSGAPRWMHVPIVTAPMCALRR